MKEILELINRRKREFADLKLFKFMQNQSIDPLLRLSWAPYLAPFAMGFSDLNKYDFRQEPTNDPIQKIINNHTYEDDNHWIWFLEDIEKLGLNPRQSFADSMRFFWSEKTYKTRQICHQIAIHTFQADPVVVLAAIEAIEATGNITLANTARVAEELAQITEQNYRYFGKFHLYVETGHAVGTDNLQDLIERIDLTEEQITKARQVVEKVFDVFSESLDELMDCVENKRLLELVS